MRIYQTDLIYLAVHACPSYQWVVIATGKFKLFTKNILRLCFTGVAYIINDEYNDNMEKQKNKRSMFAKQASWLDIKLLFLRNKIKYSITGKLSPSLIITPVFVLLTIFIFIARREWFGNPLVPRTSAELFFGAGAVTGAMLAIVFAFSSQLVSRASEALPTRYFKLFARDTKLDLFYITLGLITVLLFAIGAISLNGEGSVNTMLVRFGVWLLFLAIIMLYFSYSRLIRIMSHEYQITWLAKHNKDQIDEISYIAKRMARAYQRGKNLPVEERLIIEANMYEPLQNQVKALNDSLDGIVELYFTYKNRGDDYAAHNYIHVASGLVMSYVLSRQKNTLLKINSESGLTPESNLSAFLQTSFEKLKMIWDRALIDNDVYAIRKYLRDVQGIVRVSLMVDHVKYPYENPAFLTAYFNFRQLIKDSIKQKNVDALFEIASVLEQITEVAIAKKHKIDALESILEDIQMMCLETVRYPDEMDAVNHNLVKNMLTICNRIITQDDIDDHRLRKMQEIVPVCIAISILGINNMSLTDIAVAHFGDNIFAMAMRDMGERPNKKQIHKITQTSKFVLSILEKLASIANGKRYESQSINRSIMIMADTLTKILNEKLATDQQVQDIEWILNDLANLPNSFPVPEKTDNLNDIEDFIDSLTQAAIISAQANQIDVVKHIFDSIFDYLHKMLVDDKSKVKISDILQIVNKTKLIGATARKLRMQKLQQYIAEKIRIFESEYLAKYYPGYPKGYEKKAIRSPSPTILRQNREDNIFGYHGSGLPAYFNDAKGFFLELYSQEDLDNFEEYIWK